MSEEFEPTPITAADDERHIQCTEQDGILHIALTRHDKKNAITQKMYADMVDALNRANVASAIKVVVIEGGANFSAGNDLVDFLQGGGTGESSPVFQFMMMLAHSKKPIVAAVDGFAVGIGTTALLHCDIVYCTERTTFMLPFVNLGLVPELGATKVLPRLAGYAKAAELLMLGEPFNHQVASQIGLVNQVVTPEQLKEKAFETAKKLAAKPHNALLQTKELMRNGMNVTDTIRDEARLFSLLLESDEAKAAMAAIMNRKK